MGVLTGVNSEPGGRSQSVTTYRAARIMLIGPTGNHPSPYDQADSPLTCRATPGPKSLYVSAAYDGNPPVRCGIIAASSARQRHSTTAAAVIATNTGIAAAPMPWIA